MRSLTILIQAGRMMIATRREELALEDCLACATRQNPKRHYLFVSKVLGKHWPVRPRVMRDVHRRLAEKMARLPGPLLVIGMAETATALGRGVAEEVALQTGRDDVLYLQTTRCRLSRPLAFGFDECHSHAPDHAVYLPDPVLQPLLRAARTLVLVDDEISTGRTVAELARACLRLNPGIDQIALACITNWLSAAQQQELTVLLERSLLFPALIEGSFRFEPDPQFPPPILPASIAKNLNRNHDDWVTDPARSGLIAGRWSLPMEGLRERVRVSMSDQPLVIIGTGEYAYTPFRVALLLEEQGYDVRYQSTTRSPILVGDAIARRRDFLDNYGDGIPNYLYNLDPNRLPVIIYEHPAMLAAHSLAGDLGGLAFAVEESCRAS
jgi:adenine/guanine phosphoribosyltransferase-like PRPP-binding protein